MPSKKKKYNVRIPAGRIKKIMQSDEEIGKVAQAVPVIISRVLELFVESLVTKSLKITNTRNAKTLTTSHMKQCIMAEQRFDFLRELVKNIPDISLAEEAAAEEQQQPQSSPDEYGDSDTPYDLSKPSTSSSSRTSGKTTSSGPVAVTSTETSNGTTEQWSSTSTASTSLRLNLKRHADGMLKSQQQQTQSASVAAAISAPIFKYEICNKPIVKIDYSNISMPTRSPATAPAMIQSSSSSVKASTPAAFDFSLAAPTINIDLSNLVTTTSPPVTTSVLPSTGGIIPTTAQSKVELSFSNSVSSCSSSSSSSKQMSIQLAATKTSNSSSLDLDEDYDNI